MRCVLIVEDETNIRKFLSVNLKARGYSVLEAASAEEGLWQLSRQEPHCVILDIRLPGMSGWELLAHLNQQEAFRIPVIILTATALASDRQYSQRYQNIVAILTKPITASALMQAVDKAQKEH